MLWRIRMVRGPLRAAGTVAKDLANLTFRSRRAAAPEAAANPRGPLLKCREPLCEADVGRYRQSGREPAADQLGVEETLTLGGAFRVIGKLIDGQAL
jgi:hypothetical protein